MNRLGIGPEELPHAMSALKDTSLALVMSHLACSSDVKHAFNATQLRRFIDASMLFPRAPLSLAATAGALHRRAIIISISSAPASASTALARSMRTTPSSLQPQQSKRQSCKCAMSSPAKHSAMARRTLLPQKMRTATVALGYADGYLRSLSGRGYGVLGGAKCPILGRVSMDLIIIDVTGCAEAQPGAMVEFLGPNAPLDDIAQLAGTAPYEILTTFAGTVRKTGARA